MVVYRNLVDQIICKPEQKTKAALNSNGHESLKFYIARVRFFLCCV